MTSPREKDRLMKANKGRLSGKTEVTRSIGDMVFKADKAGKACGITSTPELLSHELTPSDRFILLSCHGLGACMSHEDMVSFIANGLESSSADCVCKDLVQEAVRVRGCRNNCTALLLEMHRPKEGDSGEPASV